MMLYHGAGSTLTPTFSPCQGEGRGAAGASPSKTYGGRSFRRATLFLYLLKYILNTNPISRPRKNGGFVICIVINDLREFCGGGFLRVIGNLHLLFRHVCFHGPKSGGLDQGRLDPGRSTNGSGHAFYAKSNGL